MADRYWVGGTATWDATAGTKWSATSGGAGGASVPTSADDVFFDAASGTVTVTVGSTNSGAKSVTFTGFTGTFAGNGQLNMSGSVTFSTTMTTTYTGTWRFLASATITSAGKTISGAGGGVNTDGAGIVVQLADALSIGTGRLTVNRGTFNTNSYSVAAGDFVNNTSFVQVINLGSSAVTLSSNIPLLVTANANLTLNAGTSTIVLSGSSARLNNTGTIPLVLANVSFTSTIVDTRSLAGFLTINNLTVTGPASSGTVGTLNIESSQVTINGTISITGTSPDRRIVLRASTYGIAQSLTINSPTNLVDVDFRDLYIIGSAAPISGTRIGDLGGCTGITFTPAKNVYYEGLSSGTYTLSSGTFWALTPGGATSINNYPLAQDALFFYKNYGTSTVYLDIRHLPSINASAATIIFSRSFGSSNRDTQAFYGSELTFGSGVSFATTSTTLVFAGRNKTCKITTAGKTIPFGITIDCFNGGVELEDAYTGGLTLTVASGTFDTKNYALNLGIGGGRVTTSGTLPKTINFGSSTITCSRFDLGTNLTDNVTLNAGTSQLNINAGSVNWGGHTYYNVTILGGNGVRIAAGTAVINNLTIDAASSGSSTHQITFSDNLTIQGTLKIGSAGSVTRRILVSSNTPGNVRTLIASTLDAQNVDFRDITIAGAAANTFAPGCGDCTGNTGIQFPAPKTVYWNLSGTQNWTANAWASFSGASPSLANFPLAHDNIIFDDSSATGTAVTITSGPWQIGNIDFTARTLPISLTFSTDVDFYKDVIYSSSVTLSSSATAVRFSGSNPQILNQNGASGNPGYITISKTSLQNEVQLASALTIPGGNLTVNTGTLNAVSYNVSINALIANFGSAVGLRMGSGTWTVTGSGSIWNLASGIGLFEANTADILLTSITTSNRTFTGGGFAYKKLTIGGNTGISTTTITGNNFIGELASTKTVAHTIALGSTLQTFAKWSVTGTAGNVVTVTGTGTSHIIAGPRVEGVDYLAMGSIGFSAVATDISASSGEFYAGANSTGTNATIIKTAAPTARTLYWVGGTGNWSDTARWSLESGGTGGQVVPTSVDDVIFDANSGATSYTMTMNVLARCKSFTMSGPATGTLTWAGTSTLVVHGNFTLAATGVTRSFSGEHRIILSGTANSTNSFTTNGVALGSGTVFRTSLVLAGYNVTWNQQSAIILGEQNLHFLYFRTGTYNSNSYDMGILGGIGVDEWPSALNLGSSNVTLQNTNPLYHSKSAPASSRNFTFNAGTSTINITNMSSSSWRGPIQFYNVVYGVAGTGIESGNPITFGIGTETYNNLTIARLSSGAGYTTVNLPNNITVNGSLIISGTVNPLRRVFIRSNTIGTQITLTCNSFQDLVDVDFRDINLVSESGPVSGTRLGDVKGNTGIIFASPKTVYWTASTGNQWMSAATPALWSTAPEQPRALENHPLPQDTAVINDTAPASGQTISLTVGGFGDLIIPTLDLSQRTLPINISIGTNNVLVTGNLTYSNSATLVTSATFRFIGRNQQYITSAGKSIASNFIIASPGGEVILLDSLTIGNSITVTAGTFNANNYNVTASGVAASTITALSTINLGNDSTWTLSGGGGIWNTPSVGLTIAGTATMNVTFSGNKSFNASSLNYSGLTLNIAGAGALTITGNNTFKNITNTYKSTGAASIIFGATTQRVEKFEASGEPGRLLTIQGTSGANPATLILTGSTKPNLDYLNISNIRAYPLTDTWYAGNNSTNLGSLGFSFTTAAEPPAAQQNQNFFMLF